jgi:hypothetical protein
MNCPHCTNGVVSVDENDMIVLSACTECSGYGIISVIECANADNAALFELLWNNPPPESTPDVPWTVPLWTDEQIQTLQMYAQIEAVLADRPSFTELQVDHTRPISHAEYIAGYREWKAKRT